MNLTDGGLLHVQQVLTYVNGTTDVGVQFALEAFDNAVTGRLYEAADLYVAGNDAGVGSLDPGPPLQVGGINAAAGSSARLVQGTPAWNHYQESFYDSVYSVIGASTDISAPNLSDTVNASLGDNDLGVQWNFADVAVGAPQVYSTTWRFKHFTALELGSDLDDSNDGPDRHGHRRRAQRRRQPRSGPRGALLDRRREPRRRSGDDGR